MFEILCSRTNIRSKKATTMDKPTSEDVLCPADAQSSSGSGQMDKSTSENVLCPADPQSGSGSGQILSGQVVSSKVMEEALHLNLKLTPFESFPGDGSIFKAFFHGKVICTKVLSKVLPAVTFKGGERDEEGNGKVVLQNDTLLSFNVIAREMVSLRGDAGLDLDTDHTIPAKGDDHGGIGDINRGNDADSDIFIDDCDPKNDTMNNDTRRSYAVPAMHKCKVCGKKFEQKSMLKKHQLTHENRRYFCSFGCRAFSVKHHLVKHMRIHTRTRDHVCKICSRAFFDASSLETHQYVHSAEKPFKCMHCDKAYTMQNTLQRHIVQLHADTCTIDEISVKSEKSVDQCIDSAKGDKSEELENIQEKIDDIPSSTEHSTSTVEHDRHIDNGDTKNDSMITDTLPCPIIAMCECKECGKEFENKLMLTKHQLTHEKYKYACSFGCRAFTRKDHLVTHMKIHTRTRDHICKICAKAFFDASSLETHQFVHSDEKPFKCMHCDKAYTMHNTLKKHISRDHAKFLPNTQQPCVSQKYKLDPEKKKYTCSFGCGAFADKYNLIKHMKRHTRTRDHVCKICSKAFLDASSLDTHQFVHSTEKPFKCTHCDKAYTMRNSLNKHALTHQAESPHYKCEICGKLSLLKCIHNRHLLTHSNVKAFQCEVCGKQFRSKNSLVSHELIHKGYKKFQCDQCDKSYRNRQYLEVHKKTHTGENLLQCELCGDWFSDPGYFKRHQRDYCKARLNIHCEICGKSFPDNRHLVSHMGLHSGERPFGCDICGKAFAKAEGLADHVKRHNPDTDFRCRYCGKLWISKSELTKHEVHHERQKQYARLPEEMKPGHFRPETTVRHRETSKPDQAAGSELGTPGIEEIAYTVTDTSGGSGRGHQQIVYW